MRSRFSDEDVNDLCSPDEYVDPEVSFGSRCSALASCKLMEEPIKFSGMANYAVENDGETFEGDFRMFEHLIFQFRRFTLKRYLI